MFYSIFRNSILVVKIKPNDTSELVQKKQSEDIIKLNFTLEEFIDIKVGDYITFEKTSLFYILNKKPKVIESPKNNRYECIFEGNIHELRKTKVLLQTEKTEGGYYQDYKFPLTGNAQTFLSFIVDNLNREGGNYTVGSYKDTETLTIDFNNWNVFEAITELSTKLEFDWYLEGNELNFDAKTFDTTYTFQVGRFAGFRELTRLRVASENIETIVYGYGSTDNLPPRTAEEGITYDSELLTENRLSFSGVDGKSKLENNVSEYGEIMSIQEFDDIKPERIGTVTAIDSEDSRVFFDTGIDFDIEEQKLEGIKPKVNFLTGTLLGLNFDIAYDNDTNKVTMDYFSDESGQYPNDIIRPAVGDTYKLFDLIMPESYIIEAQTRLEEATQAYLDKQSNPLEVYEGIVDEVYIESANRVLDLGDLIRVISAPFGIDNLYEIKELIQSITNPFKYAIKFGDVLPKGLLKTLQSNNFNTQQSIYSIEKNTYNQTETNNQTTNIINEELSWEGL